MSDGPVKKTYEGRSIAVTFEAARCQHAAECVRGLPAVFDVERRPWIQPDNAAADLTAEVVRRCPSGALGYQLAGGAAGASGPPEQKASGGMRESRQGGGEHGRGYTSGG